MGKYHLVCLLFLLVSLTSLLPSLACPTCPTPTPKKPKPKPPPPPPSPPPTTIPCPPPPPRRPKPPPRGVPPVPLPPPTPVPSPPKEAKCPIDTLKLGACVDLLGGLVNAVIGKSVTDTCCPVLEGLVDADAALCLCTTIKAKLLNINIVLPIALELLINCGKNPPPGYQCPA